MSNLGLAAICVLMVIFGAVLFLKALLTVMA